MIRRAWERFLCKFGQHDWYEIRFVFGGWNECYRCGREDHR